MAIIKFNETDKKQGEDILSSGVNVIEIEAKALSELANILDENFVQAVEIILEAKGRIIVTGMGKSGHIGKKIAATMASTGTPAFFVHPAEASHGDMGMIINGDVVLAISNSGESKELVDLIEYTRRFAIPLLGITSREQSTLAKRSDIALLLPKSPEACPNGLAPTTSTTLTLAIGDALSVALLKKKGFTAKDFKLYHPGGKLGQQLMKVSEIMHSGDEMPIVQEDLSVTSLVDVISDKGFGCAIIVNSDGALVGIITDGDIRRKITMDISNKLAKDIMSINPMTIQSDSLVAESMAVMNDIKGSFRKITSLAVLDEKKNLVGILHLHDCLKAGF